MHEVYKHFAVLTTSHHRGKKPHGARFIVGWWRGRVARLLVIVRRSQQR